MQYVEEATRLLREYGCKPKNFFIYVLIKDDLENALIRVNFLKKLRLDPFAQLFRDYENTFKRPVWFQHFNRWVNRKQTFRTIDYEDYVSMGQFKTNSRKNTTKLF